MNNISLKKISLYSLSFLALSVGMFTNQAEATETKSHSSSSSSSDSLKDRFLRTEAIQESELRIGRWSLEFSAAIREQDPNQQAYMVQQLLRNLTESFEITFVIGDITITATDYASLLALVQEISSFISFDSNLTGNFALDSYHVNDFGQRIVHLDAIEYVLQTIEEGPSIAASLLDQFKVVETHENDFKIKHFTATVISVIPLDFIP